MAGSFSTQLIGAVIVQMSLAHLGMAENLDVALFLVLQAFLVSGLRQKQAGPFAFPAHRRIVGQHIEDNHVPGVLGKPLQIHVLMAVVVLRPGLEPHFLHQLAHGLTLRHGAHLLSPRPWPFTVRIPSRVVAVIRRRSAVAMSFFTVSSMPWPQTTSTWDRRR